MDQLKPILAQLKKHHFWIEVGLIPLIAIAVWWKASSTIDDQYTTDKGAIEGVFTQLQTTRSSTWPTVEQKEQVASLTQATEDEVFAIWTSLYAAQQEHLAWPTLMAEVAQLAPDAEITPLFRERYRDDVIALELKRLQDLVRVRRPKEGESPRQGRGRQRRGAGMAGGMPGGMPGGGVPGGLSPGGAPGGRGGASPGEEWEGLVEWDPSSLQEFADRYQWSVAPSTTQVRITQEDLWLLQSILQAIELTNRDADDLLDPAVHAIRQIDIGQGALRAAADYAAKLETPGQGESSAAGGVAGGPPGSGQTPQGAPAGASAGASPGASPGGGSGGSSASLSPDQLLLEGRYVDETGAPLAHDKWQSYFAEFRQVPVLLEVSVDQRKLPELLGNLSMAVIPVEIVQLQLNPGTSGGGGRSAFGAPAGGVPGGMPAGGRGAGPAGGAPAAGGMAPGAGGMGAGRSGGSSTDDSAPYDVTVVIQGVAYLYNVPDKSKLGSSQANDAFKRIFVPNTQPVMGGAGGAPGGMPGGMPGMPGGAPM